MGKNGIIILISGRGSNLEAIIKAVTDGLIPVNINAVIADRDCKGLEIAKNNSIKSILIKKHDFKNNILFEKELIKIIEPYKPKLLVLAGFMHILSLNFLKCFRNNILNIHPSLLPSFKGLNTHKKVLEAGVLIHGCTVHIVTSNIDEGPILGQAALIVRENIDVDNLEKEVLKLEHKLLPECIALHLGKKFKHDKIKFISNLKSFIQYNKD